METEEWDGSPWEMGSKVLFCKMEETACQWLKEGDF